ncbi:tetratricopeptide repeat-containing sensor histidine kinase [Flavobacterium sp. DGU11]|uniref:histidine kinase n=1 Tax=Flavobacterium arundinis TaxID=3139143 RepID=A0ABU9HSH0_9FLAO
MARINFTIVMLLCFQCFLSAKEKPTDPTMLNRTIKNKALKYKSEPDFYKAHTFFLAKNWDSTLVYSMRQLSNDNNSEIADYCHYFRAISFLEKKLLEEAKKEFLLTSGKFIFANKVKLSLGEILLEQKHYWEAISKFNEIEKLPENKGYGFKRSSVLHNLGLCYLHLQKYSIAEKFLFGSLKLQERDKDTLLITGSCMDIGTLYYEQYKDQQAIEYFKKAYDLSKKTKDFEIKRNAAINMAVVEENRNDFQKALGYRKEYENWKDSLNNQNKVWELAEYEKRFAIRQKQKELNVLTAENKLKKTEQTVLFIILVAVLLFLAGGIYVYRQKVKTNTIISIQKAELDELNSSKDRLFSIVSHDLRSSVNALKQSNKMLLQNLETKNFHELDKLLQNNSTIANGAYNLLDNLLNWALLQTRQSYFNIEPVRIYYVAEQVIYNYKPLMLDKHINFENSLPKNILLMADTDSLKIILRNLLDNAIKFSYPEGIIRIYLDDDNDGFSNSIVIEDNGRGMSEDLKQSLLKETVQLSKKQGEEIGTGLGLQLCKSLIKKNKGKFSIKSRENKGTKMIVSLPKSAVNG